MEQIPIAYKKVIQQIDTETGKTLAHFSSIMEAAKTTSINFSTISKAISPKYPRRKIAGGYYWRRLNLLLQDRLPEDDLLE